MRGVFLLFSCALALGMELFLGKLGLPLPVLGLTLSYFAFSFGFPAALGMAVLTGLAQDFALGRAVPLSIPLLLLQMGALFLTRKVVRRDQILTLLPAGGAVGLTAFLGALAVVECLGEGIRTPAMIGLFAPFSLLFGALCLPFWTLILDFFAAEIGIPGFREVPRSQLGRRHRRRRSGDDRRKNA